MRTIQKVNVEVKDDEIYIAPVKEKHLADDISRVRIHCIHDGYPESFFYMGKGADTDNWIPESSTPSHLSSQTLAKIAWQLRDHLQ